MEVKVKKSTAMNFAENDEAIMKAAQELIDKMPVLFAETRFMIEDNPESKGNVELWNTLVDIEESTETLASGAKLSEEEVITLGNNCALAHRLLTRGELERDQIDEILSTLNGLIFKNEELM